MILNLSTPKDMREQIEMLATCQIQTNEALMQMCEALDVLKDWIKHQEQFNKSLLDKLKH